MANDLIDPKTGEVLSGEQAIETTSMVAGLARAEIDQQIATARQYPRVVSRAIHSMQSLATHSQDAAAECNYALPRGGKTLTGPSIRLAELVVSQWGNCRVGARVVHVDRVEKFLEAEGVFHDLESNAATTARVRRKISDKNGRLFSDDMITVAGNAACSIAKRNAVLAGVPKAAWMPAYEAALATIRGDQKTLSERREGALRALGTFGITPDMLFDYLEVGGIEDITLDHMPALIAMHKALKDGEHTVESLFPPQTQQEQKSGKPQDGKKRDLSDKLDEAATKNSKPDEEPKKTAKGASKKTEKAPQDDDKPDDTGEGDNDSQGGSDAPDEGETYTGDPATEEQLTEARDLGQLAAEKGRSRDAPPANVKGIPELLSAWREGFDSVKKSS